VIGNGSNCLFDSQGFRGCVIVNRIAYKHTWQPGVEPREPPVVGVEDGMGQSERPRGRAQQSWEREQ